MCNKKNTTQNSEHSKIALPIFLLGFMACGKTTYGAYLAQLLNVDFVDMDDEIEKKYGKKISEIFIEGEDNFRKIEQEILHEIVSENQNAVIALGGGTPCFFDNIKFVNENGISIYLKCTVDELYENILLSQVNRPLLENKTGGELRCYIKSSLEKRKSFYEQAQIILTSENHNAQAILARLSNTK